ncbi:MAG: C25 family cysteine peptidase [Fibrobacteria bacterium]
MKILKRFPLLIILGVSATFPARPAQALEVAVDCDYLILTDSLLLPQARRLADFRSLTALDRIVKPQVATMGDIEREYPVTGQRSLSVSAFLRAVKQKNGKLPVHLVLFGDASVDPAAPGDRVPTYTYQARDPNYWNPIVYDTLASDDVYGTLLDTLSFDSLRFSASVGRVPASTIAQARAYVDKVEAYETHYPYGPMAFTYGFANDDQTQHGAPGDQDPITDMYCTYQNIWDALKRKPFVRRMLSIEFPMDTNFTKPAARDSLLALMNAGPTRLYFAGHSSMSQFTDEKVFKTPDDLPRLKPKALQPIVAFIGSSTAGFADRYSVSMGEELLFHPHGSIAFFGPMSFSYPNPALELMQRWGDSALQGGTLGTSISRAKSGGSTDPINDQGFALLGDPGLTLRVPAFDLVPAAGSSRSRLTLQDAGAAGDSIYLQLVQVDTLSMNPFPGPDPMPPDRVFLRERLIGEVRGVLGAGGAASLDIPWISASPSAAAIKVMTWNGSGMRYGHFPLSEIGPVSLRKPGVRTESKRYRIIMENGGIHLEIPGSIFRRVDVNGAESK